MKSGSYLYPPLKVYKWDAVQDARYIFFFFAYSPDYQNQDLSMLDFNQGKRKFR